MAEKKVGHHWKLWVSIFLVIGIMGLLFYTNAGRKTLNFFNIGRFVETSPTNSQYFTVELDTNEDAFYSQHYELSNTTFTSSGLCQQGIIINDINLSRDVMPCEISLNGLSGSFDYTQSGSVFITGKATSMKIDNTTYGENLKITIEIIPNSFLLADLSEKQLTLPSVTGKISKIKADGNTSVVGFLNANSLDISNFNGLLKLDKNQLILNGMASSVGSQEFKW